MKPIILILLSFFITCSAWAQGRLVKGHVIEAGKGLPMPGVTVIEKGTSNGVVTDLDGNYTLRLKQKESTLIFSYLAFETQFVAAQGSEIKTVRLKSQKQKIDEVVVMGYGSVKSKESIVGSVEQVKSKELLQFSNAQSVDQMLEGQVAGVQIESDSGDPTSPVKVRIRGNNSLPGTGSTFTASSEPLYILDGVPLVEALNPNNDSGTGQNEDVVINPLALINPEDIESVSILKDASAAAIYGANAANGVIIITTKKGVKGQTKVTFSQKMLYSTPIDKIQYLNTEQYAELCHEFYRNSGYAEEDIPSLVGPTDVYTDWQALTQQNAMSRRTNVGISGGGNRSTFRLSLGYNSNETTTKGNDFQSTTMRLSLTQKLTDNITLIYNGGLSSFKTDKYSGFATYAYKPNISPYDENGNYTQMDTYANPLADIEQNTNNSKKFYSNNSLNLKAKISKNWSASSLLGIDYTQTKNYTFYSKENGRGRKKNGFIKESRLEDFNWVNYNQIEYNGSYLRHTLTGSIGMQLSKDDRNGLTVTQENLITEKITIPGTGSSDEDTKASGTTSQSANLSYYGRLNYDFAKKYFLSISYRSDASSYFGGDKKQENFMSLGGSWIVSKENFWRENEIINFLKIKTSYGKLGNARVGSYSANGIYSYNTSSDYNGNLVATPNTPPNPDLGWQKTYKFNLALSMKVFKKFGIDIDYYNNKTKDGIMSLKVAPETGWTSIPVNSANLTNYGVDMTLKANNISLGSIKWTSNFNIGLNRNRLDELTQYEDQLIQGNTGLIVGESTSIIMGSKYAGVNSQTGDPMWYLKDGTATDDYSLISGDPTQKVIIGQSSPDFIGGFSNSFSYKGFSFSFMLTYEYGADKMMPYPSRDMMNPKTFHLYNKSVNMVDRWQKPGDITDVPRLDQNISFNAYSDQFMYDMTNISLRSISLNYQIPSRFCESIYLNNASVGVNVTNVFTWYKEKTPEGRNGIEEYRYPFPQSRTFAFQLNIGL
ncbi:SusC/RagA family TonB-linked outer membrane protein [Halosquirtibacter xylanolyticus]|uniref:SusC/RagA family TonB-linked outer membrane protein n=1 Tax=Halosquirtibacter xylanolyticus TaxID=3374599 RepID=UPI0037494E69|nr:SusC/RagA family TonB-linked outer membrane protein [Prolixibacteraceae bacterium]